MRSFTDLKRILVCSLWNQSKYCTKVCRFYYNNMEKKFWAIKVHTGKMQKFATVSSQISIMRYVQRTLLLSTLVCFCSISGPKKIELIHVFITTSFHFFTQGTLNQSSKSHRLTALHILRDWPHVIYFQLAPIGIPRLLTLAHNRTGYVCLSRLETHSISLQIFERIMVL